MLTQRKSARMTTRYTTQSTSMILLQLPVAMRSFSSSLLPNLNTRVGKQHWNQRFSNRYSSLTRNSVYRALTKPQAILTQQAQHHQGADRHVEVQLPLVSDAHDEGDSYDEEQDQSCCQLDGLPSWEGGYSMQGGEEGKSWGEQQASPLNDIRQLQTKQRQSYIQYLISMENSPKAQPLLTIIHFNDVYDLQPKGGSMGVCNFKAKIDQLRKEHPNAITLFSGDCFSPSTLTNIKGGGQMVYALNQVGIDCACFGNHEFDLDYDKTVKLARQCNWPWLLGNIKYTLTGQLLGEGKPYIVKYHSGLKIGILGVAGEDWVGILSDEFQGLLEYEDCFAFSRRTSKYLKEDLKCDIVIALTHMRNNVDLQYPKKVPDVDISLGGHDHVIMEEMVNGIPVIKSGSNFNNVGLIQIYPKTHKTPHEGTRFNYDWKIHKVTVSQEVDKNLQNYVNELMEEYSKFDEVVGYTDVPLETRFCFIRKEETNFGNFFADLSRSYYDTDISAINAGMLRNDSLIPVGKLTYSKVSNIIDAPLVAKRVSAKTILEMLEYSVKEYPGFAGSFLFVSGLRFEFDYTKTPRVQRVWIGKGEIDMEREYTITTTSYQARGGDGFEMLKKGQVLVDEVKGTSMLALLLKFFKAPDTHQEYESIKALQENIVPSIYKEGEDQDHLHTFPEEHLVLIKKVSVRMGRIKDFRSRFVLNTDGSKLTSIAPAVDKRIVALKTE